MTIADIIRDGTLVRDVKVGLGRYASLYQIGPCFYVTGEGIIDFRTCKERATRYLESIRADI